MRKIKLIHIMIVITVLSCQNSPKTNTVLKFNDTVSLKFDEDSKERNSKILSEVMKGSWHCKSYSSSNIAAMDNATADSFLGQLLLLTKQHAIIFQDTCNNPIYEVSSIPAVKYQEEYLKSGDSLDLKSDTVYVIHISCGDVPVYHKPNAFEVEFDHEIVFDNTTLTVINNGIFFHYLR